MTRDLRTTFTVRGCADPECGECCAIECYVLEPIPQTPSMAWSNVIKIASEPLLDAYSQLSGRKGIRHRQRVPLVGFQSNLLGQHDVARDEIIPRHEAPASPRSASVV